MLNKQVERSHYNFSSYMSKARWISVWHQLDEVNALAPSNVLEIGPGIGVFKAISQLYGIKTETLDLDPELKPDYIGSATDIPLLSSTYDVVCAFQILEHLPYDKSLKAFSELVRVSRSHIVISLPDAKPAWRYAGHIPKIGAFQKLVSRPLSKIKEHHFDGEHYWEINKKSTELKEVLSDFSSLAKLIKTYRVCENPYHRFFVFEKYHK